jgi:thiol-disulfide isomerase/thioredoxin
MLSRGMKSINNLIGSLFLSSLKLLLVCAIITQNSEIVLANPNIGTVDSGFAPSDVPFFDEKGVKHYLDEYDGKVVLVIFWASWCHSCLNQLDQLDNLKKDFKKIPFEIIIVSEDFEGIEHIKSVFTKYEVRHLYPYYDMNQKFYSEFGVKTLPSGFLVSENGEKVLSFTGEVKWYEEEVRRQILSFISGIYEIPRNTYTQDKMRLKFH